MLAEVLPAGIQRHQAVNNVEDLEQLVGKRHVGAREKVDGIHA